VYRFKQHLFDISLLAYERQSEWKTSLLATAAACPGKAK